MSEHTPGPWRKSLKATDAVITDRPMVGTTDPKVAEHYGGEVIAESIQPRDRDLITAAPDLLAACEAALWEDSGLACADQLRAAIRAAGKEPQT